MDINTDNIINLNIPEASRAPSQRPDKASVTDDRAVETALGSEYGPTIARALAMDNSAAEANAVEQAKIDLQNNTLETYLNAQTAARNILKYGI